MGRKTRGRKGHGDEDTGTMKRSGTLEWTCMNSETHHTAQALPLTQRQSRPNTERMGIEEVLRDQALRNRQRKQTGHREEASGFGTGLEQAQKERRSVLKTPDTDRERDCIEETQRG